MKLTGILICAASILLIQSCNAGILSPTAKITIRVIDTKGNAIPDAEVGVNFYQAKGVGMGWGTDTRIIQGRTDKNGLYSAEGESGNYCDFGAKKIGFYSSSDRAHFQKVSLLNRWEPWNPTIDIVLKEKRYPVAMYGKQTDTLKVPILDTPVGYDLEKDDWASPYGKGVVQDFVFTSKVKFISIYNTETSYKLTFSNPMDGIQEYVPDKNDRSEFKWPYEAPESGYKSELSLSDNYDARHKYVPGYNENKRYIFRVRTKVDEKGNIISANYGKLKGDIELKVGKDVQGGLFKFEYYFNPSGSKSLEYGSNLIKWTNRLQENREGVAGP